MPHCEFPKLKPLDAVPQLTTLRHPLPQSPDLLPHHHNLLNHLTLLTSRTAPTPFHHYLKTLDDQGRLLRCYTQNIDGLEQKAGLDLRVPVEGDFPKRRRTGMSRDSSRKSDVFGKNRYGEVLAGGSQVPLSVTAGPLDVPSGEPVPSVSLPISRLLNNSSDYADLRTQFKINSGMADVPQAGPDGFDVDPTFMFTTTTEDRPYAAENDPFCQTTRLVFRPTVLKKGADMTSVGTLLSSSSATLNDSESASARSGSPAARAASAARSISGTTDTSATSVSGKIDGHETDVERSSDNRTRPEPTTDMADRLSPPTTAAALSQPSPIEEHKLPRCVPLHGTLANLECSRCSYSQPLRDAIPLPPEMLPCPSCEDAWEERVESSQRPRSIGFLRASVLLYGEEHRHGDSIGAVVERDLLGRLKDERMDLLVVAGTTLQIPGVKRMIKEFAKALRTQPAVKKKTPRKSSAVDPSTDKDVTAAGTLKSVSSGEADDAESDDFPIQTILLNRDPPGKGKGGEWANTFDVWVQGDLQEFVEQWVVHGPSPDTVKQEPTVTEDPTTAAPLLDMESKMEVTKVEGTKITLKSTATSSKGKRKNPPSPEKSTANGKPGRGPKNPKMTNAFNSVKSVKSSPQKKRPIASPDTSMEGDFAVEIPAPAKQSRPIGTSPKRNSTKTRAQARKEPQPEPSPRPVTASQPKAARPMKTPAVGTRRSARQQNAASSYNPGHLITPQKRGRGSACSSPLSALSSDEEECSSQGVVEKAL